MIRLRCGEERREVLVRATKEGLRITVDGVAHAPDLEEVGPGRFLWRRGSRTGILHCVREGDEIHLSWEGTVYRLVEESEERGPSSQRHAAGGLEAPMPGKVIRVGVEVGQAVARGDEVVVIEAMKMENALRAPRDGTVRAVRAKVGEMVAPGAVLVEIE